MTATTSNNRRATSKPRVHPVLSLAHIHPQVMLAGSRRTAGARASAARVGDGNNDHQHVKQTPRPVPRRLDLSARPRHPPRAN
jgi:hypothetical protein